MAHTAVTDPPSGPPPPRVPMATGDKVRFVLRGIGQTFTAGDVPAEAVTELLRDEGCGP